MKRNTFYSRFFAYAYDAVMRKADQKELAGRRKALISRLSGSILKVGVGTGANFSFYGQDAQVLGIEPSGPMLKRAKEKLPQKGSITLYQAGIEDPELDKLIPHASLDAVVCTLVLCTIPSLEAALDRFHRWLNPQELLIVLEHIRSKKETNGKLQDFIAPAWKAIGEGCHLNRRTDTVIKNNGFETVKEDYFKQLVQWYQGIFIKSDNLQTHQL
ncbi:class I SAM-dependent methyltransferase [Pontibacter sp. 172403-2]|uniref:class I SAM-dependent methyltransferase n=1 Tax=Pontibacter rufus TaxID=2791028 RepID=UPI0018AFFB14|nr:class I SAM-dependent methyltransferase [Pontibacter sp. 172403-2]MBF9252194.1 class I SAM-dependent methyltransferase [Pontibacter sp. 172403-2]